MPRSLTFFAIVFTLCLAVCGCVKESGEKPSKETVKSQQDSVAQTKDSEKSKGFSEPYYDPQIIPEIVKAAPAADATELLQKCAEETNNVVLAQYATFLSKTTTNGAKVREAFRKMLKSDDPFLREQTLMALEDYAGVAFLLDDMIPLLNDPDEDVRDSAMTTIADYVESNRKIKILIECLDSSYDDVKENAIFNLGFYTDANFETAEEWKKWWAEQNAE